MHTEAALRQVHPSVEKLFACTEADFKNMPRVREKCAKFVRGVVPRGPRKLVQNMRGGIKKCAEIVQKFARHNSRTIFGGASENVSTQRFLLSFPTSLELFNKTQLHRQINSQSQRHVCLFCWLGVPAYVVLHSKEC